MTKGDYNRAYMMAQVLRQVDKQHHPADVARLEAMRDRFPSEVQREAERIYTEKWGRE